MGNWANNATVFIVQIIEGNLVFIITNMQGQNSIEKILCDDVSGLCLHCVGHSEVPCFCPGLVGEQSTSITYEFISISALPPQASGPANQENNEQKQSASTNERKKQIRGGKKPKTEKFSSRKLKKDNISHKRISTVVKNIAQKLLGGKLSEDVRSNFHRVDYAIRIFDILEREGLLRQAYECYTNQMNNLTSKIETSESGRPEYCEELLNQIKSYEIAFRQFLEGRHEMSMRIIYDFENMRQKGKFHTAVNEIEEIRKQKGLPFERI